MASTKKILTLFCVALVAFAFTGCSDDAAAPTAVAIDTAPPAVPANLDLAYQDGSAVITWDANTIDADLAGYIVTRENDGRTEILVASPSMIHTYVDAAPLQGSNLYHVYAVDTTGNQSAVATVYLTVTGTRDPGVELAD